jgi:tetratricopeptide (TPR) repeat protein
LGLALNDCGQPRRALAELDEALRLQPDSVPLLWQIAWILSTSPDSSVHNGPRAVQLARRATELSGGREPRAFDALAAALAETEHFTAAVDAATKALALARAAGDDALVAAINARKDLYRQGLPYRQEAPSLPAEPAAPKEAE